MTSKRFTTPRLLVTLAVIMSLLLTLVMVVSNRTAAADNAMFTVTTNIQPTQVEVGAMTLLILNIRNNSETGINAVANVTVTDPQGEQVFARKYPSQYFPGIATLMLVPIFQPVPSAVLGTYKLNMEILNSNEDSYYSADGLATFNVVSGAAARRPNPTATPQPQPTATSVPQPTATAKPTSTPQPQPTATAQPQPTATPQPPTGASSAVYWGAYTNGVPWDMSKQDTLEGQVQKKASIIHFGLSWWQNGQFNTFPTNQAEGIRQRGSIPMINWGSWDYCCGTEQPNWRLSNITNGQYDNFIRQWATSAKAWGHPFFLRFDHEMNGWWQFPWSEQLNGNQPGDYARAWQHVHDIFNQVGANNVTWVWCPNIVSQGTTSLASLYPGSEYVDWVAMDGYNWASAHGNPWMSFSQVFGQTYNELLQVAPGKPIMVGETASLENGGSKADWISNMLQKELPKNFPMIKALVWFNWNDNDSNLSWPVESSVASIAAFAQGIGSNYYASNQFANLPPSKILPLR